MVNFNRFRVLFSSNPTFFVAPGADVESKPLRRWLASRNGEPAGTQDPKGTGRWVPMARDSTCQIRNVRDLQVHCRVGKLWVTYPEYQGDTVLAAGERLSLTSRGLILIVALENSSIWLPDAFVVDHSKTEPVRRMALKTS